MAEMSTDDDRAAKQDIAEVLVRYATSIDRSDWTSFRTCFTDRCDVEYEGAGSWRDVEAITELMTAVHAGMGHTLHRVSNIDTVVDGPNARARSYVDAVLMASDGLTGINTMGWYDDELVLAEARWEIARRRFTMVRMQLLGTDGDASG